MKKRESNTSIHYNERLGIRGTEEECEVGECVTSTDAVNKTGLL